MSRHVKKRYVLSKIVKIGFVFWIQISKSQSCECLPELIWLQFFFLSQQGHRFICKRTISILEILILGAEANHPHYHGHLAHLTEPLFLMGTSFRLYINSLYLTFSPSRPWLSTRSPCTSHRATPGGDRLKVSKKDGPRLLPQPPPIEVIAGNDVKDEYFE